MNPQSSELLALAEGCEACWHSLSALAHEQRAALTITEAKMTQLQRKAHALQRAALPPKIITSEDIRARSSSERQAKASERLRRQLSNLTPAQARALLREFQGKS